MRACLIGLCVGSLVAAACVTPARAETITGMLGAVTCGERCYLLIVDAAGKSIWGLCEAAECRRWAQDHQQPGPFIGTTVRVKTRPGYGQVVDEAGNPKPDFLLFIDIFFVQP